MKVGDEVYHVANPDVTGYVSRMYKKSPKYVEVLFSKPVEFSGNYVRGSQYYWVCSVDLLFPDSETALKNKKY